MERTNLEYLNIKATLLFDLDDEEFIEWLDCEDCVIEDYTLLKKVLEDNEMYERIGMVDDYLDSF